MFETIELDKVYNLKLTMKAMKEIENSLELPLTEIVGRFSKLRVEQWENIFIAMVKDDAPEMTIDNLDNLVETYIDLPTFYTKITKALTESSILASKITDINDISKKKSKR